VSAHALGSKQSSHVLAVWSSSLSGEPMSLGTAEKWLVVNADDFGLSRGVNRGILAAHDYGIVMSTSVMVRGLAAAEVADAARLHPALSLGLHIDMGEWVHRDGGWTPLYTVLSETDAASPAAVADEVSRQLNAFRTLVGRDPTHLDSHQHAHRSEPLRSVMAAVGQSLDIPLRHFDPVVRYCGAFYGQTGKGEPYHEAITAEALCRVIAALPVGVTELACHPGADVDHASAYASEREMEVAALCDPRVALAVRDSGIRLGSFSSRSR
jgi:predicted glycoside hydrolase/deacetylase ChbG (UPF0249 family)